MKWMDNKTFPYPVLSSKGDSSNRDYVGREFQVILGFEIEPITNEGRLDIEYQLSEESLLNLIKKNKARYATEIHCRDTYLRRLLVNKDRKISEKFKKGELHQHVEISSYVVCVEPVQGHKSNTIHPEFGKNAWFDFEPGDVLAVSVPDTYWVEPNLARSLGTIFHLEEDDLQGKNFSVDWGDDSKIQIIMNTKDAKEFDSRHRDETLPPLLASVYLYTLAETLRLMESEAEEHSEKKWFNAISQRMSNEEILPSSKRDFLSEAQKLLDYPVHTMLTDKED